MAGKDRCLVRLEPSAPPGHSNRKARAFQLEILRLRDEGYSLDAIRAALADAGVRVSKSTVHREAVRRRPLRPVVQASQPARVVSAPSLPALRIAASARGVGSDSVAPLAADTRTGQDIARDFMDGRITNPLILARRQR
jgi:DNA-binding transcriptional MerR regulator